MFTPITTGPQTADATGALTGTADVSAIAGEFSILILATGITCTSAAVAIQDSAVGDFSDAVTRHTWNITGPGTDQSHHASSYDTASYTSSPNTPPAWRHGSSGNAFRINVTSIAGGSITINALIVS
jgi:hypothetical protein